VLLSSILRTKWPPLTIRPALLFSSTLRTTSAGPIFSAVASAIIGHIFNNTTLPLMMTSAQSNSLTGARWLQRVINHIWTHLYKAWTLRNADLHVINTTDKEMKRKARLHPTIVALYKTANKIDYMDK
jgi:hypothetical protein